MEKEIDDYWKSRKTDGAEKEELEMVYQRIMLEKGSGERLVASGKVRKLRYWWAAAAVVFVVCSLWFFENRKSERGNRKSEIAQRDVEAPKVTKAQITLADGRIISIEDLSTIDQVDVKIIKTADGKIIYEGSLPAGEGQPAGLTLRYNTLTNPRGSKVIDMQLSDGSHVWLNAGSSVTFPVAFVGNERKVSINGEAYFEVSHDASKPFYVSKGDMQVQVLGTQFNVNAYDDEAEIKVTLLEGSVKVSNNGEPVTIKPGQQARITSNLKPQTSNSVDLNEIMAWKNGRFYFENSSVETIMKQVEKWYDVEVEYQDKIPHLFVAKIPRDVPVSELLKLLELTERVHFKVIGKKVIVMR